MLGSPFYFPSSLSLGNTKFKTTARMNTTATQFSAKMVWIICGKILNICDADVNPRPVLKDKLTIIMLRCEKPLFAIMPNPAKRMEPNIMMVQPPRTACGMVVRRVPTGGNRPPRSMMPALVAMAKRFTTPESEARPTFWLKDVIGVQPKRPEMELTKPSQLMAPPISTLWIWRLRAPLQRALESPTVSVADTR